MASAQTTRATCKRFKCPVKHLQPKKLVDLTLYRKALSYPVVTNGCNSSASKASDCPVANSWYQWVACILDGTTWIGLVLLSRTNSRLIQRTRTIPRQSTRWTTKLTMLYRMRISHLLITISKTPITVTSISSQAPIRPNIQISNNSSKCKKICKNDQQSVRKASIICHRQTINSIIHEVDHQEANLLKAQQISREPLWGLLNREVI